MKLKLILLLFLLVVGAVVAFFFMKSRFYTVVETQGDVLVVSVYEFSKPLKVKVNALYEPRDDLDKYPWLKTFLFMVTDLSAYIPESEWELYWPRPWTPEKIQEQKATNEWVKKIVLENENNFYSNYHSEINELILCESEELGDFLIFAVRTTETASGIQGKDEAVTYLRTENDGWVIGPPKSRRGVNFMDRLTDCRHVALEKMQSRSLRARNIRWMKSKGVRVEWH